MPSNTKTATKRRAKSPAPQTSSVSSTTSTAPVPHDLSPQELDLVQEAATVQDEAGAPAGDAPSPTMTPPQLGGATTASSAGISGQKVVALWAEQTNRNAWAYLQTDGWKKFSTLTDTGSTTLTLLGAHARATGHAPDAALDADGRIGTMYVW